MNYGAGKGPLIVEYGFSLTMHFQQTYGTAVFLEKSIRPSCLNYLANTVVKILQAVEKPVAAFHILFYSMHGRISLALHKNQDVMEVKKSPFSTPRIISLINPALLKSKVSLAVK
jgi:hypothetical protein